MWTALKTDTSDVVVKLNEDYFNRNTGSRLFRLQTPVSRNFEESSHDAVTLS
jgi:hypothetical protein